MNKYNKYILFLICLFRALIVDATHIVGGELNYRFLGNNEYEVRLTVYRDCYNGQADFDNPATIATFTPDGILINNSSVLYSYRSYVPNAINTPCLTPPTNVCYEVAEYTYQVNLPPRPGGYILAYQRCCRNNSIVNLANVQGTGATYIAVIPDPSLAVSNSNPVFDLWPPTFICKDAPFTFDHGATDADGDSLVYELSVPFDGADRTAPRPNPPSPPPYNPVSFLPPYNLNNVLGGVPMEINAITGQLKATPNSLGQFVYGVSVKEYRNGVYIGETRRDFQVNVVSCPQITVASIFSPTIACGSLAADFLNTSYNASTYLWNFGDPGNANDTSSAKNPVYVYPDTGDYIATLVAYSPNNVACNDTVKGLVHVYPKFNTDFSIANIHCTDQFTFFDQSYGLNGSANYWKWWFGDGSGSFQQSPQHLYQTPGTYDVTMIASTDSACLDTLVKKVYVLQIPIASVSTVLDTCNYTVKLLNSSVYSSINSWTFGDGKTDSIRNPVHQYLAPGSYSIHLTISTDSLCTDTISKIISLPVRPKSDFNFAVAECDSVVSFTNYSQNAISWNWNFGDSTNSALYSPIHTYSLSGVIPVIMVSTSAHNCHDTLYKDIDFISFKESHFDPEEDSCSGIVSFYNVTRYASSYLWDFGDGDTSHAANPIHKYKSNGTYLILLSINDESPCVSTMTKTFRYEMPEGEVMYVPNTFTPNGDGVNDFFSVIVYRPCVTYKLSIFNRWGQKIFETDDAAQNPWDGTFLGERCQQDLYVYLLEGNGKVRKGIVNLMQ